MAHGNLLTRGVRRARLAAGALGVGFFVALSAPVAHAADCAPTDLACLAQQGHNVVGGLGGTLGGAGGSGGPVGGVTDKVGSAVNSANDTLNGLLNGGGGGSGGAGGGSGGGGGGSGGGGGGSRHHHGATNTIASRGTSTASGTAPATTTTSLTPVVHQRRTELLRTIGGTVARAVERVGFPMVLAVIVVMFVMVQNRLDRSDPKLSVAPLRPDRMRFV